MPTTLRVRNESDAAVVVELNDASDSVEIATDEEVDLEERFLLTQSFANSLEAGRLRFVFTPLRNNEQANLARRLMPRSLRVKNESDALVTVQLDNQSAQLDIAADQEVDLAENFLLTRSFATLLEAGKLSFVLISSPNNEQYNLARRLLPRFLSQIGSPLIQLHSRAKTAVKTMQKHRDNYNKSWDAIEKVLEQGETNSQTADFLSQGVEHFLNTAPEEALVNQLKQEIADLEGEDLEETGRELAEWFAERNQKQKELEKAEARLAKAKQDYQQRYQTLIDKLKESADGLKTIDSSQDIGQKLDTSW